MKTFVGDIHVHTGLSPCAAKDMTPNNIIRMAKLENRDFLVICDHHSVGNVQACQEVGAEYEAHRTARHGAGDPGGSPPTDYLS